MVVVRQVDANYAQALAEVATRLFSQAFSPFHTAENITKHVTRYYSTKLITEELNDSDMTSFMAFNDNDEPVGYCQISLRTAAYDSVGDPDAILLQRIYIDQSCKGKGIGFLLLNTCLEKAREMGRKTVWLLCWEHNSSAVKFYDRNGFYKAGTCIFKVGDADEPHYIYVKKL